MQSQGIYIDSAKLQADSGIIIYIAILDFNGSFNAKKLANKIFSTFSYLSIFTVHNIRFHFSVYTASQERYKALLRIKHTIDKHFIDAKVFGSFEWEVFDLDLEKKYLETRRSYCKTSSKSLPL